MEINCPDELSDAERICIRSHKTKWPDGYNLTDGGEGQLNPSDVTREKMRAAKLGKKQSPELVARRVESRRGYHPSEKTKARIGDGNRGKKRAVEVIKQMRKRMKGQPSPMKGKCHSEEAKAKMRGPRKKKRQLLSLGLN